MLAKPILAKCSDRALLPKSHPTTGSPEIWLSNSILVKNQLFGISFDFFVDWSNNPPVLMPTIWIKRILLNNHSYQDIINDIENVIQKEFTEEYLERLTSFSIRYKLSVQLVIFQDDYDWSNEESNILLVTLERNDPKKIDYKHSLYTIANFKKEIQTNSGGPVQVGAKGLIYGTSRLECYLSTTTSAYPGDVDLILLDSQNDVKAILEFKKHTLAGPITGQKLSNYYNGPDKRKYDRIAILRDHFDPDLTKIPIIIVYYPTQESIKNLKVELVGGPVGKLDYLADVVLVLPKDLMEESVIPIVDKILEGIPSFHKHK